MRIIIGPDDEVILEMPTGAPILLHESKMELVADLDCMCSGDSVELPNGRIHWADSQVPQGGRQ